MTESMSAIDAILSRRSVRTGFDRARPVAHDALDQIVRCGLAAPSSKNAQPWRFHVVTDGPTLDRIALAMETATGIEDYVPHDPRTGIPHPQLESTVVASAAVLRQAPAALFIEGRGVFSGGRRSLTTLSRESVVAALGTYGFECIGIGAALENMWIAATDLNVQAAFLVDVIIAETTVAKLLGIDGDLFGALAVGFSDAPQPPRLGVPAGTGIDDAVVWH